MTDNDKQRIIDFLAPYVKEQLKAPLTATFCTPDALTVENISENTYSVEGVVHSQNSYGAMMPTDFSAQIRVYNEGYRLLSCSVGTKVAAQTAKTNIGIGVWSVFITIAGTAFFYFLNKLWLDF